MWLSAHNAALELLGACLLNLIIGSPVWLRKVHPARLFIWLEKFVEGLLREKMGFELRRAGGVLSLVCLASALLLGLLLAGIGWPVRVVLIAYAFSCSRIFNRPMKAIKALRVHDLTKARAALKEYVKVDTDRMTEREAATASITYMGHAMCDACVAPLFWVFIGSLFQMAAPFALMWICVDVMDDRVGTKTNSNADIGWFSARLSDIVGFLPAWLSGWAIVIAAAQLRLNSRRAIRVLGKDHGAHPSPNGGWAIAALSGALGVQLGGDVRIGGIVMHRRVIGESARVPDVADISRAMRILAVAAGNGLFLALIILALVGA